MTITELAARLAAWEAAEAAVMRGKAYTIDGLTYTRQDAGAIRENIELYQRRLAAATRRRGAVWQESGHGRGFGGMT